MPKKLYRPQKRFKREKLTFGDKVEIAAITIASIALITWSGWSVIDALRPEPSAVVYDIATDSIASYLADVEAEMPKSQIEDIEQASKESVEVPEDTKTVDTVEISEAEREAAKAKRRAEKDAAVKKAVKEAEAKKAKEAKPEVTAIPEEPVEETTTVDTASEVYVAKESLNIRMTPDLTAKSQGLYKAGEVINVIEPENKGWFKVDRDGTEGYVSAEFVEKK